MPAPEAPAASGEHSGELGPPSGLAPAASLNQADTTLPASDAEVAPTQETPLPQLPKPGLIAAPEPRYYTQRELDIPPYVLEAPEGEADALLGRPETGRIVLELWIDDNGHVTKAGLLASDLPEEFGQSALNSFTGTRFSPGRKGGSAVHSYIRMEVAFGPEPIRTARERMKLPPQRLTPP